MSPEPDDYENEEELEEEVPRSIFAATWFRLLLGVILLAVVGVLALPYVLDWLGPSARPPVAVLKPPPAPPAKPPAPVAVAQPPQPAPQPAAPAGPSAPPPPPAVAGKPAEPGAKPVVSERATAPTKGDYWVQVGAFREAAHAARLAARLTAEKYSVQRATVTRGESGGGNEVFVAGASRKDLSDRVTARGYAVEAAKGGLVVRPLLPLREAVALSRELADAGMEVKIRRVGGGKATFHLVRVGGFPDRSKAEAVRRELEGKGIPGFIAKGAAR